MRSEAYILHARFSRFVSILRKCQKPFMTLKSNCLIIVHYFFAYVSTFANKTEIAMCVAAQYVLPKRVVFVVPYAALWRKRGDIDANRFDR